MNHLTIRQFEQEGPAQLADLYDPSEAKEIIRRLLEEVLGCNRTELLLLDKDRHLSASEAQRLTDYILKLSMGHPLQYVLGYADFAGYRLVISEGALIPRPETEELVSLILADSASAGSQRILDIGTGSGCIAYALAAGLKEAPETIAIEVSSQAIPIAQTNFSELTQLTGRSVKLWKKDLFELVEEVTPPTPAFDLIVSNPPYIAPEEADSMAPGVLLFEPHLALFAPEESPIAYYQAICELLSQGYLAPGGHLWLELNPIYAEATKEAFYLRLGQESIHAELIQDLSGKLRFLHLIYLPSDAA